MKETEYSSKTSTRETNVKWMLVCPDPSPLAFFRFSFPTHRSRTFDTCGKVLESALKQCNGKDRVVQKRLLEMQKKFNVCNLICFYSSV